MQRLQVSTSIMINTNGLKHSYDDSIYFTLLVHCFLKHKPVLSDLLGWTNNKLGKVQSKNPQWRKSDGRRTTQTPYLINNSACELQSFQWLCHRVYSSSAACTSAVMHFCSHATQRKNIFLYHHVCRMPNYFATKESITFLEKKSNNGAPSNHKCNWAKCMTSITGEVTIMDKVPAVIWLYVLMT